MLRRSPPQYRDDCSRPQDARGRAARAHHAGAPRKVRLGPIAFWIITGTYFAFREDVLAKLLARHAEMQFAYEDRLAGLRAQIDRFSSRQLIDQEAYEKKLEQILRRQASLESRAGALSGLGDITGTIRQPSRGGASGKPRTNVQKPARDKGAMVIPFDRGSESRTGIFAKSAGGVGGAIERLLASLDRLEQRQAAMVGSMAENYDAKARRIRGVLAELGLDLGRETGAVGGPFVPAHPTRDAGFEPQLHRIQIARAQIARLTRTLGTIPVRKPIDGEMDLQSS